MAQNGLLRKSENLGDLLTAKSFAELSNSAGISTCVRVAAADGRLTAADL